MQRLIFFIILTLLLIKPTANAIFLSKVGVSALPLAYILVAFIALIFTIYYNKYITALSPIRIFHISIKMSIGLLVLIGIIIWIDGLAIFGAYLFYLFVSIFGILTASQFWILANQIFDAREARKYFGFIGFGAIAGGIVGGYLASILSTLLQSEVIPFFAALILVFVLKYINSFAATTKEKAAKPVSPSGLLNIKEPIRLILDSRHLKYIAIVIALSVFTSKMIDFQFGYFAMQTYTVEEDLTAFYGFMYSTFNLVAISIQVFLTTRVIGRLGVGLSLVLLPALLVLNAGMLMILPCLVFVGGLKLVDASMKQSINKSAIELIMLPVPKDIKLKTKTFLDVFIDSFATGLSGIVLILILQTFDLANWIITLIILISTVLWVILANKIRKEYKQVFRKSLNVISKPNAIEGKTIEQLYKHMLLGGSDNQILKALGILIKNPLNGLEPTYRALLQHKNALIVKAVIEVLMYEKSDYAGEILPLLKHDNQNVRIAAFEYIINHQEQLEPNFLIEHINSNDDEIKIIALVAYAKEFKNDPRTLKLLRIEDRLLHIINDIDVSGKAAESLWAGALKAIGNGRFVSMYKYIDKCLESDNLVIRKHALLAAGETQSSIYLTKLLSLLESEELDRNLILALSKFPIKRLEKVIQNLERNKLSLSLSRISNVLESVPSQDAIKLLQLLIEHEDVHVRNSAIVSLRVLTDQFPLLQINGQLITNTLIEECKYTSKILNVLSLYNKNVENDEAHSSKADHELIRLIKQKIDNNLQIIFELLHLKYPPENYMELYDYVKGADIELRNNAVEYVESSLSFDLKSAVIPLLEYVITPNNHIDVDTSIEHRKQIRNFLLQNKDNEIRIAAADFYLS